MCGAGDIAPPPPPPHPPPPSPWPHQCHPASCLWCLTPPVIHHRSIWGPTSEVIILHPCWEAKAKDTGCLAAFEPQMKEKINTLAEAQKGLTCMIQGKSLP
eukprot:2748920-Pyramimonas_sp.AAC.1